MDLSVVSLYFFIEKLTGHTNQSIYYFENAGSRKKAHLASGIEITIEGGKVLPHDHRSRPNANDWNWDGDGDPDVLIGTEFGGIYYSDQL